MFYDPENILISDQYSGKTDHFMIYGFTAGLEFKPFNDAYIRGQYSFLTSGDPGVRPFNELVSPTEQYWADYYRQSFTLTMGMRF
jgi:hypothetical protein